MKGLGNPSEAITPPEGTFWIGPAHPFDLHEAYLNFRFDVHLEKQPRQARLFISADSRYRLWLNGFLVGGGPERSWPWSMAVDEHDVSGLVNDKPETRATFLQTGRNAIAVQVYSPGYSHFAYVHRGACGLICWLEVDGRVVAHSDPSWSVQRNMRHAARVARISIYGTGVEDCDEDAGPDDRFWTQADPQGWHKARIVQAAEGPIWQGLRRRRTPQPEAEDRLLPSPWQMRLAPSLPASADPHEDLRQLYKTSLYVDHLGPLAEGMTGIWIFDLGETRQCAARLRIHSLGGEKVLISYAERLRGRDILLSDPETYCRMRPTDRFTLPRRADGPEARGLHSYWVEGFALRGARFVIFAIDGCQHDPAPRFVVRLQQYPLVERPLPDLPPTLNAIAEMCRRTTLACLQDGFVDGVWRESSLWLGDAVAQDWALRAISDDPRPLLFAIDMAAEGVDGEGLLPSVLPGEVPAYAVTDYNFSWVELLAGCASHPGITEAEAIWRRHWGVLQGMLARFATLRGAEGLIRNPPGRRLFLDWSPMDRGEPNLTLNLRYLHALKLASGMAGRLGLTEEPWAAEAEALAAAILRQRGPAGWRERPGGAEASQLALAFLILTGLAEAPGAMADRIVARSLAPLEAPGPALASPFMHHYLFQALHALGRGADIGAIIAHRWGEWVAEGDVTTRENWRVDFPDGSAAHGFSAHPLGWLALLAGRATAGDARKVPQPAADKAP